MSELAGPMEFLELAAGESRTFTVVAWGEGETTIKPSYAPEGKVIPVLRVQVDPADKPTAPHYYDVTSLTLQAQMRPQVAAYGALPRRFTVTKVGTGPSARFTLATAPPLGSPAT